MPYLSLNLEEPMKKKDCIYLIAVFFVVGLILGYGFAMRKL